MIQVSSNDLSTKPGGGGRGEGGGGGIEKWKTPKCLVLHKTELSRDIC